MIEKCPRNRFYESFVPLLIQDRTFSKFCQNSSYFSNCANMKNFEDISHDSSRKVLITNKPKEDDFSLKSLKFQGLFFSFKMQFGIKLFIYRHLTVVLNLDFAQHLNSILLNLKTKGARNV